MKQKLLFLATAMLWLNVIVVSAQTSGLIYKPSSTAFGRSILDPNGDGFTSNSYSGFSSSDYGTQSELKMVGLPVLTNEPLSDVSTGPSGGHTDISNNGSAQSVYVLVRNVDNVDYLIIRFRLGSASTAPKGYSLLLDTDNNFNNNYSSNNPGFEREVILEASKRIRIYSHSASGETILQTYDVNEYHQRSIAMSTGSGNADYFYDFFVPYSAINANGPVRMAAATITSAQSGISGTSSDFNGVNDSAYGGNKAAMAAAIINSFPAVPLTDIREGYNFIPGTTLTPTVSAVTTSSSTITGTSLEPSGTLITVYRNGVQVGTTTVTASNTWSLSAAGLNLQLGQLITATATAAPRTVSATSEAVTVTSAQGCYTTAPVITARNNGSQTVSGTWSNGSTITANNVRIRFYYQNPATGAFVEELPGTTVYVATNGTWSLSNLGNSSQTTFADRTYYVTATIGLSTASTADDCTSAYSNGIAGNGSSGTITATPNITTTTIVASTGSTNVSVQNTLAGAATLYLYVNGVQVQTASVAANATHVFSYAGFVEGDIVSARAKGTAANSILSNLSNQVTVTTTAVQTTAPVLKGPYVAGTQTIKGTSTEVAGTVVTLYINGVATTNTATVDIYGNWQFTGIALTAGQVVSVRAKANGKSLSNASNTFTVAASAPTAPTVTGPIFVPTTATASISGTGGSGTVTVYVDGTAIGTTTGANWTLNNIDPNEIFRGGVVTATNTNTTTGITSASSAGITIQGVVSFLITDINGNAISEKKSGETFPVIITAKSAANGTGSTYTNFTGKVVVSSDAGMLVGGGQTLNFVNGVVTHTVALGDPGIGRYIFAINSDDPTAFGQRTLDMVEAIWKGTLSTDYAVAANWVYNFVPADGATISFAEPTLNHCLLDQNRILGSISNTQTNYNLNLNGHKLQVNGDLLFTNNAKINATTEGSTLVFAGKNAQALNSSVLISQTIYGLESAGLSTLTLTGALDLTGVLTLTSGTLNTQNNLTMKSNALRTAVVAPVTKGSITGNVIVERYFPAKRAYRFISSPVNTTTSIHANWQEGANNTGISFPADNINPVPGFGTHITGSMTGANGLDATDTGNASLFTHNNTTAAWTAVTNTLTPTLTAGSAFRLMIRGDRSTDLSTNTPAPSPTIIRTTGTLQTGNIVFTDLNPAANGVSLVGNPYQSPVDVKTLLAGSTNVRTGYYYIWDPTQSTRGAYVTIDMTEADDLPTQGQATRYVQPGQAFMVRTDVAGTASLTFREELKQVNTATASVFRNGQTATPKIRMQLYESTALTAGESSVDGLIVKFSDDFNMALDALDAGKPGNQDENFAVKSNNKYLSIESRPFPVAQDTIYLFNNQYRHNDYVIKAQVDAIHGLDAYLHDSYTETTTLLEPGEANFYEFIVDDNDDASMATDRFRIVFAPVALGTDNVEMPNNIVLFPNPTATGSFSIMVNGNEDATIVVSNSLGQVVYTQSHSVTDSIIAVHPATPFAAGIYYVAVKQGNKQYSQKLIVR